MVTFCRTPTRTLPLEPNRSRRAISGTRSMGTMGRSTCAGATSGAAYGAFRAVSWKRKNRTGSLNMFDHLTVCVAACRLRRKVARGFFRRKARETQRRTPSLIKEKEREKEGIQALFSMFLVCSALHVHLVSFVPVDFSLCQSDAKVSQPLNHQLSIPSRFQVGGVASLVNPTHHTVRFLVRKRRVSVLL